MTSDSPSPIETPERRRRSWAGPLVGLLTLLVVVGLGLLVLGDWLAKNMEATRLITRIEASEAAMIAFQSDVEVALAAAGDLTAASPEQVDAFNSALQDIAKKDLPAIAEAGDAVAATPILPIPRHGELADARDAYLAHNQAWQDYLTVLAEDPTVFAQTQEEINSTFLAAEDMVRDGIPDIALFDLEDRVDVIFAPAPVEPGGPTQAV